jgi:STE24 endopeptidase
VTPTARRTAALVAAVGAIAFGLLAWWLVPWDPVGRPVTPVPAHEVFSPAEIARAESYARWARTWGWGSLALSLVVACWLGFTTAGERLVARLPGPLWLVVAMAVAAFELIRRLLTLPFAVALQQLRLDAGLATQEWGDWARDVAVSQLIVIVTTSIAMVIVVVAAARWKRVWPAIVGVALAGFVLLASFVYPLLVEPLFNRFTSLPDGSLRTQVLALAEEEGVRVDDVLVADASRRTTSLNAYVSGYGSTRRVVLYDTLVEDAPKDQALSVVAHELAHARHDDPLVGTALGAAGALVGVGVLGMIIGGRASDPRRVPRVLALLAVGMLVSSPVQSGISRVIETRADVDALAATTDPDAFAGLHRRLALRSLADPTPPRLSQWVFGTHPTVLQRIGLAESAARG